MHGDIRIRTTALNHLLPWILMAMVFLPLILEHCDSYLFQQLTPFILASYLSALNA